MNAMDCETCNDLLMDLLYDELDAARAAEARAHVEGCAACGVAWARVSNGRRLASTLAPVTAALPSATLLAAVEAAAKQNAALDRPSAPVSVEARGAGGDDGVAPVVPLDHAPRRLPTWLHRLGDLAMRRQVAMAAVVLLSVGVVWKFVPSHTPSSIGTTVEGDAPEVIPATELPSETVTAAPAPAAESRRPHSRMMRSVANTADHRAAARPASPTATAPAQRAQTEPALVDEGERIAQNAVSLQRTAPLAVAAARGSGSPVDNAAYRTQPRADGLGLNAPAGSAATGDRALDRGLPASPLAAPPAAPAWRARWNAGEDPRAHGDTEGAIASYRAALEGDPPESERTRIATALIGQLSRAGRVAEVEAVRARYLRPAREPAAMAAEVPQTQAPTLPSSVPHPSTQRPARRAMPAATNIQSY